MTQFELVRDIKSESFIRAMKIYNDSFPANERQPLAIVELRISNGTSDLFVGIIGSKVVFMALLFPLKETKFILLDYMATAALYRNGGIGSEFILWYTDSLKNENRYTHLIMEVEDPLYGTNRDMRKRRIQFYKRLGAKILKNINYILPALSGNDSTEMLLMILPAPKTDMLDGIAVKNLIRIIYHDLYGRKSDDILLNSFINNISTLVELI